MPSQWLVLERIRQIPNCNTAHVDQKMVLSVHAGWIGDSCFLIRRRKCETDCMSFVVMVLPKFTHEIIAIFCAAMVSRLEATESITAGSCPKVIRQRALLYTPYREVAFVANVCASGTESRGDRH